MTGARSSPAAHVPLLVGLVCLVSCACPELAASSPDNARSVASLVAPAYGSAVAFGRRGHFITTRLAVGQRRIVRLVTSDGRSEWASVHLTNNGQIVVLEGHLSVPPLRGTRGGRLGGQVVAVSGRLNGLRSVHGHFLHGGLTATSLGLARAYEGAPILDARGEIVGVATANGPQLRSLSVVGLRLSSGRLAGIAQARQSSSSLLAVVLVVFAFGVEVGFALVAIRARVSEVWMARRSRRQPTSGRARTQRSAQREQDTGVEVVLRARADDGPVPEVRLIRRSQP
jgi:hypothetical protein